jgi:UDP-2,3-diacylglucosamine hydrolase
VSDCFVSDIHLYPFHRPHPGREPFHRFLSHLAETEPGGLWILGDLFDYWFEYRTVFPAGFSRTLTLIRDLSDKGWRCTFIPGNHDWWCGSHLERETGMRIIRTQVHREVIQGIRTVLAHGDGLGNGDLGYRLVRPVLRSSVSRFLFSLIHPSPAAAFAEAFSHTSRRILRKQIDTVPPYLSHWALGQQSSGADLVVTGHTHCPSLLEHSGFTHASLGDWINHFTYLHIKGGEVELREFRHCK